MGFFGYGGQSCLRIRPTANSPIRLARKSKAHSDSVGMGARVGESTATVAEAVLFAGLPSLSADVVTVITVDPLAGAV